MQIPKYCISSQPFHIKRTRTTENLNYLVLLYKNKQTTTADNIVKQMAGASDMALRTRAPWLDLGSKDQRQDMAGEYAR